MLNKEINIEVAELLGYSAWTGCSDEPLKGKCYIIINGDLMLFCNDGDINYKFFNPSTNLNQAVDYIIPVLSDMGHPVALKADSANYCFCYIQDNELNPIYGGLNGKGDTTSQKLAHALCMVFLQTKEKI